MAFGFRIIIRRIMEISEGVILRGCSIMSLNYKNVINGK